MKRVILALLFLCTLSAGAQKLTLLKKTDSVFKPVSESSVFALIDSAAGDPEIKFVASIRASMRKNDPTVDVNMMRQEIEKRAKKLGANSYSVNEYVLNDSSKYVSLTLDTYLSSERALKTRKEWRPDNILYVCEDPYWYYTKRKFNFRYNKEKITLGYREYFVCSMEPGDLIKLRKGLAGMDISVFGGMPTVSVDYLPYQLFFDNTAQFHERRGDDIDWIFFHTFYIHAKTCAGCIIPPNAIPKAADDGAK